MALHRLFRAGAADILVQEEVLHHVVFTQHASK